MHVAHLAKRFFGALSNAEPAPADERWTRDLLNDDEQALWGRMSAPDRRHAIGVARLVDAQIHANLDRTPFKIDSSQPLSSFPAPHTWSLTAALLHDVGKISSGLGTWRRAVATLVPRRVCRGSFATYKRHDSIGSELLRTAGSHEFVVAWAAEHHRPESSWTAPFAIAKILKACDDD